MIPEAYFTYEEIDDNGGSKDVRIELSYPSHKPWNNSFAEFKNENPDFSKVPKKELKTFLSQKSHLRIRSSGAGLVHKLWEKLAYGQEKPNKNDITSFYIKEKSGLWRFTEKGKYLVPHNEYFVSPNPNDISVLLTCNTGKGVRPIF